MATTVILTDTNLTQWEVPFDWNSESNTIEVIGGGGGGSGQRGAGGGGAGYAKITNKSLTPGTFVDVQIGTGGAGSGSLNEEGGDGVDSWFESATTGPIGGGGSGGGPSPGGGATGGAGGVGSNGLVNNSGGAGGDSGDTSTGGAGGGGGAGGPLGTGGIGGSNLTDHDPGAGGGGNGGGGAGSDSTSSTGGDGGNSGEGDSGGSGGGVGQAGQAGTNGSGGGGGNTTNAGGDGGDGTDAEGGTAGSGGGSGGGGTTGPGGAGGLYGGGAGGGGSSNPGGDGGQGVIIITYDELAIVTVGLASETDTAFDVSAPIVGFADTAVEADNSFSVGFFKAHAIGIATEDDQGRTLTSVKTSFPGVSEEVDSAPGLGNNVLVRLVDETDESLEISAGKVTSVGVADETDEGTVTERGITLQVGVGDETDAAQGLIEPVIISVGRAIEEDEALPRELALTDWPETLPQSLLLEGLSISLAGAGFRRDMESGEAYQRQVQTDQIIPVSGNIWVSKTQYDTLVQFWKGALAHGTRNFKWKHPITGVDAKMQMVADQPPVVIARNGNDLLVQLEMEILPDPIFLPGITVDFEVLDEFDQARDVFPNLASHTLVGIATEFDVSNVVAVG